MRYSLLWFLLAFFKWMVYESKNWMLKGTTNCIIPVSSKWMVHESKNWMLKGTTNCIISVWNRVRVEGASCVTIKDNQTNSYLINFPQHTLLSLLFLYIWPQLMNWISSTKLVPTTTTPKQSFFLLV